jgi:hypothetical protein
MEDSTNNTNKKKDLQIDTDLACSTSDLTLSTADSGLATPANDSCSNEKWDKFYKRVNRTPPKAIRETDFAETVNTAEELLRCSGLEHFQNKSFDKLDDDQQSIMIFMIVKKMHKVFGPSTDMNAHVLIKALCRDSKEFKRMISFVRLGGDRLCPVGRKMERSYYTYTHNNRDWRADTATTIFNKNPKMKPFVHLQTEESYICAYTACSALLYYFSYNSGNISGAEDVTIIKMNISRFVRDEVSGDEIANFTLTDMKGAYLDKVLLGLVQSFGTNECQEIQKIKLWANKEDLNYGALEAYLENGLPMVFSYEALPAFADYQKLEYSGKVVDYYLNMKTRPANPKERAYHTLICVGIKPRNHDTPPMLLVQDSCHKRPFFSIGLDLLMDMGIEDLQCYTIPEKWRFNYKMEYVMKPSTRSLFCGSPMSLDSTGVPRVLTSKKHAIKERDMSRCLKMLDPKNDLADGMFVFET